MPPGNTAATRNSRQNFIVAPRTKITDYQYFLPINSFDQSTDVRPLCQYGSSEVISSCAWFTNEPKVLAAGMGMKYIRVYDTRGTLTNSINTLLNMSLTLLHTANGLNILIHRGSELTIIAGHFYKGCSRTVHGPFSR
jgi:hypothetical protein